MRGHCIRPALCLMVGDVIGSSNTAALNKQKFCVVKRKPPPEAFLFLPAASLMLHLVRSDSIDSWWQEQEKLIVQSELHKTEANTAAEVMLLISCETSCSVTSGYTGEQRDEK